LYSERDKNNNITHASILYVDNMTKRSFHVVIEQDEDGFYVASVPGLPGCHTQAKTLDKLMERTKEAVELVIGEQAFLVVAK